MKTATLQDVANLAGVSVGTVSNYINGQKIRVCNAERIKNAIEALHYVPSPLARNFARGCSNDILMLLIAEYPIVSSTWLYELPIIQGVNDIFRDTPFNIKMEIAYTNNPDQTLNHLQNCIAGRYVDGIMLITPWEIDPALIHVLSNNALPYVVIGGSNIENTPNLFNFDNESPIYDFVTYLYANGHRNFAMLSGFKDQLHMIHRERGFFRALEDLNLNPNDAIVLHGDYSMNSGTTMADILLAKPNHPTAFICGNDNIAAGAIRSIHNHGLSVPQDIAVTGFDNTDIALAVTPMISSVNIPSYEIGRLAASELYACLNDKQHRISRPTIRCNVIYRQST